MCSRETLGISFCNFIGEVLMQSVGFLIKGLGALDGKEIMVSRGEKIMDLAKLESFSLGEIIIPSSIQFS